MSTPLAWLLAWCALVHAALAPASVGRAYHYRPGLFAAVAAHRGMALARGQVDGFASVPDCARVDVARPWVVLARIGGALWARPVQRFQVVDCSNPRDLPAQRRKRLVLEVDYATAHAAGWAWPPGDGHAPAIIVGWARLR